MKHLLISLQVICLTVDSKHLELYFSQDLILTDSSLLFFNIIKIAFNVQRYPLTLKYHFSRYLIQIVVVGNTLVSMIFSFLSLQAYLMIETLHYILLMITSNLISILTRIRALLLGQEGRQQVHFIK